jgi:serine phosphatase RsbU (regulator of sigma subunit)
MSFRVVQLEIVPAVLHTAAVVRCQQRQGRCGDVAATFRLPSGNHALIVIDAAGHGEARAQLADIIAEVMIATLTCEESPGQAVFLAHEWLATSREALPYAVAFAAIVHPLSGTVLYACAGLEIAFVIGANGRARRLVPTSPMLGIPIRTEPCEAALTLRLADSLVVTTDGVGDSRRIGSTNFFGMSGAIRAAARTNGSPRRCAEAILNAALDHAAGVVVDDAAVAIVRRVSV